ncbi:MAG: hypothetical protein H0V45_01135 [Actinobacteria bacterium]|nr:hypothetical protein [Actinomycetota bacterium]
MRVHIQLPDELTAEIDRRVGPRRRSAFIARTLERALDDERRWDEIVASLGTIPPAGHEWDEDPATWIRSLRRGDARRVG